MVYCQNYRFTSHSMYTLLLFALILISSFHIIFQSRLD